MDKHGVAEGEETVLLLYRLLICRQDMLTARQGGHQHDQGGFRQVEIGDQGVRGLEVVAGIDEDIRPSGAGLHGAVLPRPGFHRAA